MSDPGKYRTRDEVAEMRKNGPLKALQKLILESGFNENELKEIDNKIKLKVNEAADFAIESELPDESELLKDIIIEFEDSNGNSTDWDTEPGPIKL